MRAGFGAKLTRKPEPGSRSLANKSENEIRNLIKSRITNRSGKRQDERDSHELNSGSQPNNHASQAPGTKHKRQATSTKSEALYLTTNVRRRQPILRRKSRIVNVDFCEALALQNLTPRWDLGPSRFPLPASRCAGLQASNAVSMIQAIRTSACAPGMQKPRRQQSNTHEPRIAAGTTFVSNRSSCTRTLRQLHTPISVVVQGLRSLLPLFCSGPQRPAPSLQDLAVTYCGCGAAHTRFVQSE